MRTIDDKSVEVLAQVPKILRSLAAENVKLAAALEEYEHREEAEKVVTALEEKGLSDRSVPFMRKVAELLASKKDLNLVKQAAELATPSLIFASTADMESVDEGNSKDALLGFIQSGEE